jgi:hypothetical protein
VGRQCTKLFGPDWWEIGGRSVGKSGGEYPPYPLVDFPPPTSRAGLRIGGTLRVPLDAAPARQAKGGYQPVVCVHTFHFALTARARLGLPRRLRPSRGTLPGPSRSRTSINPLRGMNSPSRRATALSRSRQSTPHSAARICASSRSCFRASLGARRRSLRQSLAVAFATSQERANSELGAPSNSARATRSIRPASNGWCIAASIAVDWPPYPR